MSEVPDDEGIAIPVVWVGLDEQPVMFANQFVCQLVGPQEFVLSMGQVTPPIVLVP